VNIYSVDGAGGDIVKIFFGYQLGGSGEWVVRWCVIWLQSRL